MAFQFNCSFTVLFPLVFFFNLFGKDELGMPLIGFGAVKDLFYILSKNFRAK